jgi:hypothetical protein
VGKLRNVSLTKARGAPERELGSFTVEESVFYDNEGERDSVPVLKWCSDFAVLGIEPSRTKEALDAVRTLGGDADIDKALEQFTAFVPLKNPEPAFRECVEYLLKSNRLVQKGKRLQLPDTS